MGQVPIVTRFTTRRNKMEFTKLDFTKMCDATAAIDTMEKTSNSLIGFLPEQVRDTAVTINKANFALARAGHEAVTKYGSTLQTVVNSVTETVKKQAKVA